MSIYVKYDTGKCELEGQISHPITASEKKAFEIDVDEKVGQILDKKFKLSQDSKLISDEIEVVLKPLGIELVSKTQSVVHLCSKNFTNNGKETVKYDASICAQKLRTFESHWQESSPFQKVGQVKTILDLSIIEPSKPALSITTLTSYGEKQQKDYRLIIGTQAGVICDISPEETIYVDLTGVEVKTKFRVDYQVSLRGNLSLIQNFGEDICLDRYDINQHLLEKLGCGKGKKVNQYIEITTYERGHITVSEKPLEPKE